MKKLLAILLLIMVVVSVSACTIGTDGTKLGTDANATEATEAPKADITKFEDNLDGMVKYLQELELISKKDADKTVTQADLIGAKSGVRFKLDSANFVEFYEFDTTATPDEAQKVIDAFSNNEIYKVLGIEDVKGVVSGSGKLVMLYPASSTYDYSKIKEEFVKF